MRFHHFSCFEFTGTGVVQLAIAKLEDEKAGSKGLGRGGLVTHLVNDGSRFAPFKAAVPLRLDAALQAFARKQSKVLGVGMTLGNSSQIPSKSSNPGNRRTIYVMPWRNVQ